MTTPMLTVKEVIEKLSEFPLDAIVVQMDDSAIRSVESVDYLKDDDGIQNVNIRNKETKVLIW